VRATISRRREQLADASAVQFTRDPTGLRSALEKLAVRGVSEPQGVRLANSALWINSPLASGRWPKSIRRALDTHPPLERRIAWLRQLEGANELWRDL
jgi:heat shock protein HtpX